MAVRVTLIQGGGIGFDQSTAVQRILQAAGAEIEFEEFPAGLAALQNGQPALSQKMMDSVRRNGVALKTKLLESPEPLRRNYNVLLRREMGLYAAVRPVKNLRGLPARFDNVDILVIRELTEDLYTAIEHEVVPGVVQSIKVVTEKACQRFFRFAFDYARKHGRKLVHCVHKANILKLADGLFLDAFRATAQDYPEFETKEIIVDNCCMQLVSRPQQFDVMVMGNMYGDIVSDLGAGLVGGVSATSGVNYGDNIRIYGTFHGGSVEEFGDNKVNPLPLLLPAIDLLADLNQEATANRIRAAVQKTLVDANVRTHDLGGNASTHEFAEAIVSSLE